MRLLLCALAAVVVAAPASGTAPAPVLTVVSRGPLVIRGAHFRAHERVRVTVVATETRAKPVQANAFGVFSVGFAGLAVGPCGAVRARAVGALGSIAILITKVPLPACLPARAP